MSKGCPVHGDANHGGEAEELRAGIERIIADHYGGATDGEMATRLQRLLDSVNARDSLAWLERHDEKHEAEVAKLKGQLARARNTAARLQKQNGRVRP